MKHLLPSAPRRTKRVASVTLAAGCAAVCLLPPAARAADGDPYPRHRLRAELGGGWLVSDPMAQQFGVGGGLGLGYEYRLSTWLALEGRFSSYFFPSTDAFPTPEGFGSYHAPALGARFYPAAGALDGDLWLGAAFAVIATGDVIRPGVELGAGYETAVMDGLDGGLFLRYHRAFETSRELDGWADGDFLAIGLSGSLQILKPPPPPPPDADKDGLVDSADACPDKPEDLNNFQDTDGCPDAALDSDGDGVFDVSDTCTTDPEDKDDFQDADGCPEADNDGDGVLDADDACPLVKGPDKGCPLPDRDGDGVLDAADTCPDVPGKAEFNGCAEAQRAVITEAGIEILEEVFFKLGDSVILEKSFPLLDNVATILNANPQLTKIRVEGHTDDRGPAKYNKKLSQKRAEAVVAYLVEKGRVDAARLSAVGFGPDQPRVLNAKTEADHAKNRRVQFRIDKGEAGEAVKPKGE
jgi:outer membrane protein OmpA-like peptidoglycan-associated protein